MRRSLTFALSAALITSAACLPKDLLAQKARLLVANQGDHSLSVIDPVTGHQTSAIDVGGVTGHEVAATSDGRLAFVPIYGNSGVGRPGTDGHTISVVNLEQKKVVGTIDFDHGVRPHAAIYDARRKVIYVTTELDKSITIIDPLTLKIVGTIPTGQEQSHMFVLSHDGRFGYTANVGPGTVSVLDMTARKTVAIIPVSAETQRISISQDDRKIFTADQTRPQLAVIDTATNQRTAWIPLPAVGYGTAATRDGRWLLVALPATHQVAVVDLKTMKVARTIEVPGSPTEVLERPDGKVAYVSCGSKVAAIDPSTWTVTNLIQAGATADGLAWAE